MASPGRTETNGNRFLPFFGALQLDLHGMVRSRTVQGWLVLTGLIALSTLLDAANKNVSQLQVLRQVFSSYIIVWSTAVIVVSGGAVSGEAGVVADSILSRGITRYAYILSKYASRVLTVLGVCLAVMVPFTYFASVHLTGELSFTAAAAAHVFVLCHMTFLALLGVSFSIWFDKAFVSIALLWLVCYFLGSICSALDVGFMAPFSLVRSISSVLGGIDPPTPLWKVCLGFAVPSVIVCVLASVCFARRDV